MPQPVFSDEVLLRIFSHLSLVGLIQARTVCSKWRVMVLQADIRPLRRYFLDFYYEAIEYPTFLPTRPWVLENLAPFDREAFISRLEAAQFPSIPEPFKLWILEWPSRAVLGPIWPGLPSRCRSDTSWEGATNLLCVTDFPQHEPYDLDLKVPVVDYSSSDDESEWRFEKLESVTTENLVVLEYDEGSAWMLAMDDNSSMKGAVIPRGGWRDLYFVDDRPSRAEASDSEYSIAFRDWVQWLAYLCEEDQMQDDAYMGRTLFRPYMGRPNAPPIRISDLPQE